MKLVLIEWVDSHAGRGWQDKDRIKMSAEPLYCKSVGWLITENKSCKVIVPHISGEKNRGTILQGCGDLTIPKIAIIKTTILKRN
jgi:hypothetical protein